ncbi:MAG: phosphonate metabolism protein [Roseobacter sp. MedPE-SW]|nr:MAG: phosphonate metabolism protein [Roseobacter sp. MedPE-SW]
MTFTRYAIYYAPPATADWSVFATQWLGWNMETGQSAAQPVISGLDLADITAVPRKYGLHATLKPPMRLARNHSLADLQEACAQLAARQAPVTLEGLHLARLGRFLALRVSGDETALGDLAAACVRDLDAFRAPASEAELEKRRAAGLSPAQEANLSAWGYPYVLDQFRFHVTLTGKLPKAALPDVETALEAHLLPLLPRPLEIRDLALVGEDAEGLFHMIQRYTLSGVAAG